MRVALCLDDNCGMMFNSRRQSRDRVLIADLLCDAEKNERIYITPYSSSLFDPNDSRIIVCEQPLSLAGDSDLCFIENMSVSPYASKINEIIIYRWNRHYPADLYFDFDMNGYEKISVSEFAGSSHEKITKEIWRARNTNLQTERTVL